MARQQQLSSLSSAAARAHNRKHCPPPPLPPLFPPLPPKLLPFSDNHHAPCAQHRSPARRPLQRPGSAPGVFFSALHFCRVLAFRFLSPLLFLSLPGAFALQRGFRPANNTTSILAFAAIALSLCHHDVCPCVRSPPRFLTPLAAAAAAARAWPPSPSTLPRPTSLFLTPPHKSSLLLRRHQHSLSVCSNPLPFAT